jgi:hypothetical protein
MRRRDEGMTGQQRSGSLWQNSREQLDPLASIEQPKAIQRVGLVSNDRLLK